MLDITKKYIWTYRTVCFATTINLVMLVFAIQFVPAWPLYIVAVFFGLFMIPILPTSYALAIEVTHPMPPPLVNGLMTSIAYLLALCLTQVGSVLGKVFVGTSYPMFMVYGCLAVTASIASLFAKEDLRRTNENRT